MFLKLRLSAPVLFHTMLYALGSFSILNKSIYIAFPGGSDGKESACNAGDLGSIPGLGRCPGGESMATHSSILAWRIARTEDTGGLHSP